MKGNIIFELYVNPLGTYMLRNTVHIDLIVIPTYICLLKPYNIVLVLKSFQSNGTSLNTVMAKLIYGFFSVHFDIPLCCCKQISIQ